LLLLLVVRIHSVSQGVVVFGVLVDIENPDPELVPLSVQLVYICLPKERLLEDLLTVPLVALFAQNKELL
jgi:hypothetical protein